MSLLVTKDFIANDDNGTSPFLHKHYTVRVVVSITCLLSMLGALSIVFSYICIKSIRSQGRLILFHLALMDFGVGLSNLVGAVVNFDEFYYNTTDNTQPNYHVIIACKIQAIFAHYCTGSSVLWTACLAGYMYILVFHNHNRNLKWFFPLSFIACYGLPLGLSLWLMFTNRLGHSQYNEAAWCGLIISDNSNLPDYFAAIIGYDLWIYLTITISLIIYLALFWYLHIQFKEARGFVGNKQFWKQALQFLDVKLIFIPLIFIILRIWSCILNILLYYIKVPPDNIPIPVSQALIYLSGIGDSGQGFANGILFVLLTAAVRSKVFNICKRTRESIIVRVSVSTPETNSEREHLLKNQKDSSLNSPYSSIHDESDVDI